jgi:putative inorganic carbon (hco3(-)) transporter
MSERFAFGFGISGHSSNAHSRGREPESSPQQQSAETAVVDIRHRRRARLAERPDAAFVGLMVFTGLLFFRPQNQIPALNPLHLAELSALAALLAMVTGRLGRGLSITRITPELCGVVLMGGLILATAPFSIWPGGAVATFTDVYSKIILIFILIVNTLTSRKRVEQFIWLIVIASGYIAFRAVLDSARGINLVENGRVQGSVGGMFKNPNDLALNMVAVLPLAASLVLRATGGLRRAGAALCGVFLIGAVVASQSRSGTIGLVAMTLMMGISLVRRNPSVAFAGVLALFLALPLVPASYWHRLSSIADGSQDQTGSREARETLFRESFAAFVKHPVTGVGAGQFKNYDPEGREQPWRESHNVLLQVGAELGILGVIVLSFLIARAGLAGIQTGRLLRRARGLPRRGRHGTHITPPAVVTPGETEWFEGHSAAMAAALSGWFFCALFASVAYNWTFYYLLALSTVPREILIDRLALAQPGDSASRRAAQLQEARA